VPRYVALLRGINVGGNNLIKMTALKACFEEQGFDDVATFIASGNVLFTASAAGAPKLAAPARSAGSRLPEKTIVADRACGAERLAAPARSAGSRLPEKTIVADRACGAERLARLIEAALSSTFKYDASVVLRSQKEMRDIVGRAPAGFGRQPDKYRYDVIFLKAPLTAAAAIKDVPVNPEVDTARAGSGVLYFSRLVAKASKSRLGKIVSRPIYKNLTIRNWNTTSKLSQMLAEMKA
jgi:uncharacterized protein (DUF1697 family)